MFTKIVIGIDGAEGGRDAVALARRLAAPGAELVGVSIAVVDSHPTRGANLDYDGDMRREADDRLSAALVSDDDLRGEVATAHSVAAGLHEIAAREAADLIVVGACRRGTLGRIFAGDDARESLREAPCAVAVAPVDYAMVERAIATVGVGWDGGEQAAAALKIAKATFDGASVHVLGVVASPAWPVVDGTPTGESVDSGLEAMTAEMAQLEGVESTAVAGSAAEELIRFGDEVDLLVVGSRQRGTLARVVLGSTSEQVIRRAKHPVLIVPRVAQPTAVSPS